MSHTLGNWRIQGANEDYTRYQIEAEGWGIIARVEDISNESSDNARYIVVAPELLATLEAVQQAFINGDIQFTKRRKADSDPYHPLNTMTSLVLAKVRGEA